MTDDKKPSLNVIEAEPKPKPDGAIQAVSTGDKLAAVKLEADRLTAEVSYHRAAINRVDEIRGFLNHLEIKGEDAMRLANDFGWLKGVKQNVKYLLEQQETKLREALDEIKREGKQDDNQDKK